MVTPHEEQPSGRQSKFIFDFTPQSVEAIRDFLDKHVGQSDQMTFLNACNIARTTLLQQVANYKGHPWFDSNPIHAFEAMTVSFNSNHRYAPVSLNLHYIEPTPGTFLIGVPDEMPLTVDYFVGRAMQEARILEKNLS